MSEQDWRITPKQELMIQSRIRSLSKKRGHNTNQYNRGNLSLEAIIESKSSG